MRGAPKAHGEFASEVDSVRTLPPPHPALRATFSREGRRERAFRARASAAVHTASGWIGRVVSMRPGAKTETAWTTAAARTTIAIA